MHDAHKRRLERVRLLEHDVEQDAVLALLLLQQHQIVVQRAVRVDGHQSDVPLVDRVVHQLYRVHVALERVGAVDVAQLLHQPVGRLDGAGHGALGETKEEFIRFLVLNRREW